jgi:hypothetical protein
MGKLGAVKFEGKDIAGTPAKLAGNVHKSEAYIFKGS